MGNGKYEVPTESLRWRCDPESYGFQCTDEIEPLQTLIGQDRAIRAINFGLAMDKKGYNIFVTGITGTGKASAIKAHLERTAAWRKDVDEAARDWCYLHNFTDPDRPRALSLPKGRGRAFRDSMERLLEELKAALVKAFSGQEYESRRKQLSDEGQGRRGEIFSQLEEEVNKQGFTVQPSPAGLVLIPLVNGKPASQKEYLALPQEVKKEFEARQRELMKLVNESVKQSQDMEKEVGEQLQSLDKEVADYAVNRPLDDMKTEYDDCSQIVEYLDEVKDYTLNHVDLFREQEGQSTPIQVNPLAGASREQDSFLPFRVNVFVDNGETPGLPIVIEAHPTYANLFGRIERRPVLGAYITDHTMLKAGAVHEANGGYLVVDARELISNQGSWEGLKRIIKTNEARLEDPVVQFGFFAPQGLKPEPIPTDLKVIVIGDQMIYQLLARYDEDFWELFKVKADFDSQIERNEENLKAYAAFICRCCQTEDLIPFDRTAVAKVAEYGARLVGDQHKLSTRFGLIQEVCIEASYWAQQKESSRVYAEHVRKAIEEKVYRSNLIDERIRDLITEGTIMVDVDGEVVGQVNGLAVYDLGNIAFGKPSRITARTYLGRDGVINIERESQLSGKTHDKGVLILSGYLGAKYAKNSPLSLNASLAFEQNYEGIDGDSASSTELYAILSSLSNLPIKQNLAVTGSVNQQGKIQAIGGVNQKIEGFYDVCQAIGLTGDQGVMVPHQNVKNMMLREDIVKAAQEGRFHIYAVRTIDEGIEILTGVPAGELKKDGTYPKGTVNYLVLQQLRQQAESMRSYSVPAPN